MYSSVIPVTVATALHRSTQFFIHTNACEILYKLRLLKILNANPGFGAPPFKGVRGKGSVKIHEDVNYNVPIAEKIMVKYLGNIEHPMAL